MAERSRARCVRSRVCAAAAIVNQIVRTATSSNNSGLEPGSRTTRGRRIDVSVNTQADDQLHRHARAASCSPDRDFTADEVMDSFQRLRPEQRSAASRSVILTRSAGRASCFRARRRWGRWSTCSATTRRASWASSRPLTRPLPAQRRRDRPALGDPAAPQTFNGGMYMLRTDPGAARRGASRRRRRRSIAATAGASAGPHGTFDRSCARTSIAQRSRHGLAAGAACASRCWWSRPSASSAWPASGCSSARA